MLIAYQAEAAFSPCVVPSFERGLITSKDVECGWGLADVTYIIGTFLAWGKLT